MVRCEVDHREIELTMSRDSHQTACDIYTHRVPKVTKSGSDSEARQEPIATPEADPYP